MPYTPPTLEECVQRARLDFEAELPGSNAWLFPNNVSISSKVIGALIWGCFKFLSYILKQVLVSTCEDEWLPRHGAEFGVFQKPASAARGNIIVIGQVGTTFAVGTLWSRGDGYQFKTAETTVIGGSGTAVVPVAAVEPGAAGATVDGSPFTHALSPQLTSAVASEIGGAADEESPDEYRERILDRKRNPPSVGSPADYRRWAKEVPGVTRAFVIRAYGGAGRVGVWFMMDGTYANGVPLSGDVDVVQDYLNDVAPSDATILVYAPTPQAVNIQVAIAPDTPALRQQVIDELAGEFQRRATVGVTGSDKFSVSWIDEAISRTIGEDRHTRTLPAADPTIAIGSVPVLGTVTFA